MRVFVNSHIHLIFFIFCKTYTFHCLRKEILSQQRIKQWRCNRVYISVKE